MTHWLIADVPCIAWWEFYGRAQRNPQRAIVGALERIQYGPGQPVLCFDKAPYNRTVVFSGYKANRKERDPDEQELQKLLFLLPETLRKLKIPNVLASTGFEADDWMAGAAKTVPRTDTATLYTRDRDLLQCLRPHVDFFDPMKSGVHTTKTFRDKWNLHPSEWVEVKAIAGCPTDAIPGAEGVGELSAAAYLTGKMNRLSPTYTKITQFVKSPDYARNWLLVNLPYSGTPPVVLDPRPVDWGAIFELVGG